MQEVIEFLKKNPILYLSTLGLDGKPKVRPFQFMFEQDGKFYFCTSNDKNVCKEMQKQSYVEFCTCGENYSWIRLSGKVTFTNDMAVKEKIFEISPIVKSV